MFNSAAAVAAALLAAIRAYTEALLEGVAPDEAAWRRYLQTIYARETDLEALVNRLFELAKLGLASTRSRAGSGPGYLVGNVCLKNLLARPRPCWLDPSVPLLIARQTDYSFSSGHTMISAIGAVILAKTDQRFGYIAIPLAALIAFSRLYLYVHFPCDILGGAVLGVLIGLLVLWAGRFADGCKHPPLQH